MEKVAQRVKRLEAQASRKLKGRKQAVAAAERWERRFTRRRTISANNQNIKAARINRHIDWAAGPLAPRRDVGELGEKFGTVSIFDAAQPEREPEDRKWIPLDKGDRVVITYGRDRGKIGHVLEVDQERQAVAVKDLNMMDIWVPDWSKRSTQQEKSVSPQPRHVPAEHVKLVYPLPDPRDGRLRDVIIDRLEKVKLEPRREDYDKSAEPRKEFRAIPGAKTIIPWPEVPEDQPEEENDDDTPRITVDEITFRPYLLYPPMPTSVIDELRNKYSKFRTRHTWEYEQKLEAEAQREERRSQLGKTMRTPLQELAELRARQKAAEERQLSDEQLAKIGEVMAGERQKMTDTVARR
ncbi:uncharacterized protein LTR77_010442 [Saxophila tyrrhenica]|uniref:KOW domain-containing protein n=1 Tax=Saxophila tyrrhenica TaxID=1690608 RepID=A0AAV9NZE2_9PEZI|nr:hypothetical protein LTR77_010442 [Saxophila tyrrhenica]